ncbi:hypothetical protein [Geotalea sp. SG265]|uniref:hypothetical protein n=1 Tax=Geotalea sp. SG265 TaxID=2922867 RepID=UPI001FAE85A1|nr:hypothetical protein [Geotalea sp. SG265]
MPPAGDEKLEVWSQQFLLSDASVYSRQWLKVRHLLPLIMPENLLDLYLDHIRRCTLSIIRPLQLQGEGVQFRLLNTSISLLSFSAPQCLHQGNSYQVTLCLNGGFLVQPGECGRGRFSLGTCSDGGDLIISVELSDYCPLILGSSSPSRLRKVLYRLTQAYIHKVVTIRFLARLHARLTGRKLPVKVKKQVSDLGEEI